MAKIQPPFALDGEIFPSAVDVKNKEFFKTARITWGNAVDHWSHHPYGEAAETTAALKNFYYRYCNTREDMRDQLRELASQNGLTIFFEIHSNGPGKQEEYAIVRRLTL